MAWKHKSANGTTGGYDLMLEVANEVCLLDVLFNDNLHYKYT